MGMKRFHIIALIGFSVLHGCSSKDSGGGGFGGGGGSDTGGADSSTEDGLTGSEVLSPRDNAADIVLDQGVLYYSTQYDPAIYSWDPVGGDEDKISWDWRDLEAFTVHSGLLYGSFSDSGIEGWVSLLTPPKDEEELASKAADGTLFRRPGDLVILDGKAIVVDEKLGILWSVATSNGQVQRVAEAEGLLAVTVHQGDWVASGNEGVFGPNGTLDERSANALFSHEGELWGTHIEHGLFQVGGDSWVLNGPARPGPLVVQDTQVFVVDEVGGGIWAFELPAQ